MAGTPAKSHLTAVVIIPPDELWGPIQGVRKRYDKKFDRWMPHLNLLYPFRPPEEFDEAKKRLTEACRGFAPFEVTLAALRHFHHGGDRHTIWVNPEPSEPLVRLQQALLRCYPECDDVTRFPGGFKPHLSLGQARGREMLRARLDALYADWRPLAFTLTEIAIISRTLETPFETALTIPIGADDEED